MVGSKLSETTRKLFLSHLADDFAGLDGMVGLSTNINTLHDHIEGVLLDLLDQCLQTLFKGKVNS